MKYQLGSTLEDIITGFQGIATGYVSYITGCNQYLIAPKAKNGAHKEPHWVDEARLVLVADTPVIELHQFATAPVR